MLALDLNVVEIAQDRKQCLRLSYEEKQLLDEALIKTYARKGITIRMNPSLIPNTRSIIKRCQFLEMYMMF